MFSKNKIILGCVAVMLVFGACSNEDANAVAPVSAQKAESGENAAKVGAVEDLSNAHIEGRAVNLSDMDNGEKFEYHSYEMASKVRVYELDSVTLDATGNIWRSFILDTNGNFRFENMSLNSPYVMIETEPTQSSHMKISPRLIIDVRKTNGVSVNMLTYLESFRLRHLVQTGVPFDSAKALAQREVLDAFGLYEESPDYEKKDNEHAQDYLNFTGFFFENIFVDSVAESFSQSGLLRGLDSWSMHSLISWASTLLEANGNDLEIPYEFYEAIGRADYYQYLYKQTIFAINFLSALHGLGKCTADIEGSDYDVTDGYFTLRCNDNQWKVSWNGFNKIDYSVGTMTDNRNGKTYRTVTYNIEGTPLTVMAENLDFGDGTHTEWCFDAKPEDPNLYIHHVRNIRAAESSGCGVYGGLYRAIDALSLDTTFLVENAFDTCVSNYQKNWRGDGPFVIDSNEVRETCYFTYLDETKIANWADSVETANGHVQGICPDGWHIPSVEEWRTLWAYLRGVNLGVSPFWDPSGFALKHVGQKTDQSDFIGVDGDIYFATKPGFISAFGGLWSWTYQAGSADTGYGIGIISSFVRCMKN